MNQSSRFYSEETQLLDTIGKLSHQLNFSDKINCTQHSLLLLEVIDSLEEQLDSIRGNRNIPRSM